jgi:hypothetical protein
VLRSIALKPDQKMTMAVCDNGTSYRVVIQAAQVERITTGIGELDAQRLNLTVPAEAGARAVTLWLSTDAAHVPVKMSAQLPVGAFVLTLSSRK